MGGGGRGIMRHFRKREKGRRSRRVCFRKHVEFGNGARRLVTEDKKWGRNGKGSGYEKIREIRQ